MLEANALKPSQAHSVAPFLQPPGEQQIGKALLRPDEFPGRFRPLLPVTEQLGGQRFGVAHAHAAFIQPAAQRILGLEILVGCVLDRLRRIETPESLPVETSLIVRDFSSEWFSKHRYEEGGDISRKSSNGFAGYALKKMKDELQAGARTSAN